VDIEFGVTGEIICMIRLYTKKADLSMSCSGE